MTNRINNKLLITSDEKILEDYEQYKAIPNLTAMEFFTKPGVAYELLEDTNMLDDSGQIIDKGETYANYVILKHGTVVVLQEPPRPPKPTISKKIADINHMVSQLGRRPILIASEINHNRYRDFYFVRFICPSLNNKIMAIDIYLENALNNKQKWGTIFRPIAGHEGATKKTDGAH